MSKAASGAPQGLRRHVALVGKVNAGKSTLYNALLGQDRAITSPAPGTTTDAGQAAMELIPFGPIVLMDTAGLGDRGELGDRRMDKTRAALRRADAALYVTHALDPDEAAYMDFKAQRLPHLRVFTHCDLLSGDALARLEAAHPTALLWHRGQGAEALHAALSRLLGELTPQERPLVGDLLPPGSHVVLVTPIDSAAPKGRLILPQVQTLRDCLDHGITCTVCRETELEHALKALSRVDLVVTDSQAFGYVAARLPQDMPLTSFSMLLARQKGDFEQLLKGIEALDGLPEGACVLMLEGCTHNPTHQDIGRAKIPAMLQSKLGRTLRFDHRSGYDFPDDLSPYALAIQCGGCMLSQRELAVRLDAARQAGLPITNYGTVLAWGSGILARSCRPLMKGSAP